ncbi:MAG TPA: class I SAM-dependent methyltransferase [Candidatus Dormibacteraeota bacterium]|jgi:2-polyprenyl-6-hydroxyphenyl methylase/3-demethylubiquinone-9 3-methyltransferase
MSIGSAVRTRLGRFETPAAEAYRALFINLDDLADTVARLIPRATRVLEIGCGDGAVADRICRVYRDVEYVGIDVSPNPGRRYTGDRVRATFRSMTSSQLRASAPAPFDLVLIVDVLHHVPAEPDRVRIVADAAAMITPGGTVLVKEWERSRQLSYLLGATCDRFVSGDRAARFMNRDQLTALIAAGAPDLAVVHNASVRPWRCNALTLLQAR